MSCDLHIHSTCSDGAVPIERLASIAARTGLHAIALSDHDTLLSAQYAYAHTGQDGVELIPAVELTGYDFDRQHRVHLLCYYPDVDCPALREHCAIMKERRNACALQSAKELEQLYPQFTTDLAWETTKASGVLFKSGLMQALELLGLTDGSIYGETYHKLFGWNPRGIVLHSPEYLPVRQVLATAKASGGAVVFAHPRCIKVCPCCGSWQQRAQWTALKCTIPATARRIAPSALLCASSTALWRPQVRTSMAATTSTRTPSAPVPHRTKPQRSCAPSPKNVKERGRKDYEQGIFLPEQGYLLQADQLCAER